VMALSLIYWTQELERFSQLLALCFSLLNKETDQATGPMIMKFALVVQPLSV
jgi:hypothetical protein